ncbi:MAG TPA: hypothetical protein VGZ32_00815 [Actinocrinis sp.]|uniref:hypothetical protein n=1 Tax=Actinocrinis sp. TaxID=1920516 RepID=UPI002DDD9136|nr:hypothetical protein [Actinocrinis sp.]HEV3168843.1 hypothetical protein [Actinocrinis sp.]
MTGIRACRATQFRSRALATGAAVLALTVSAGAVAYAANAATTANATAAAR